MIQQAQMKTEKFSEEMKLQKEEFVGAKGRSHQRKRSSSRRIMQPRKRVAPFSTS